MDNLQIFKAMLLETEKSETLAYKSYLLEQYAIASVDSMLSSLNSYLKYCGRAYFILEYSQTPMPTPLS